jgi:transposase-like protein
VILDARYERVREDGEIRHKAVQIAIGINEEGRRCVLSVEVSNRESLTSWIAMILPRSVSSSRVLTLILRRRHAQYPLGETSSTRHIARIENMA